MCEIFQEFSIVIPKEMGTYLKNDKPVEPPVFSSDLTIQ